MTKNGKIGLMIVGALILFSSISIQAQIQRVPRPFTLASELRDGPVFNWPKGDFDAAVYESYLDGIATLGARHLVIPYYGCQSTKESSEVGDCQLYPDQLFLDQARIAQKRGFTVTFLPVVLTPAGEWRGEFAPKDVALWFKTYTKWVLSVAALAQSLHMPEFVAATEFKILYQHTEEWKTLLREVRKVFSGPLIVVANWDILDYGFWEEADALGVSYYYPLSKSKNPTDQELDASQAQHKKMLLDVAKKYNRPLYINEVGYPSLPSAASEPWYFPYPLVERISDKDLQKRCMESFARAWSKESQVMHIGFWATSNPAHSYSEFDFEYIGKPIASTISKLIAERAQIKRP